MLKFKKEAKEHQDRIEKEGKEREARIEKKAKEREALMKKELEAGSIERVSLKKELRQTKSQIDHLNGVISKHENTIVVLENRIIDLQHEHDTETEYLRAQLRDHRKKLGLAKNEKDEACGELKKRSKQYERERSRLEVECANIYVREFCYEVEDFVGDLLGFDIHSVNRRDRKLWMLLQEDSKYHDTFEQRLAEHGSLGNIDFYKKVSNVLCPPKSQYDSIHSTAHPHDVLRDKTKRKMLRSLARRSYKFIEHIFRHNSALIQKLIDIEERNDANARTPDSSSPSVRSPSDTPRSSPNSSSLSTPSVRWNTPYINVSCFDSESEVKQRDTSGETSVRFGL